MTVRTSDGGVSDEDVLAVADGLYREAAVELFRVISAIRSGELSEIKAAHTAIRDLRGAAQHVRRRMIWNG